MIQGYDWTIEDTYAAQNMCPYETVSGPVDTCFCKLLFVAFYNLMMPSPPMMLTRYSPGGLWLQSFLRSLHL